MIKLICDRCGNEISDISGITNAVFPIYSITMQESPFVIPRNVDFCAGCETLLRACMKNILFGSHKEVE